MAVPSTEWLDGAQSTWRVRFSRHGAYELLDFENEHDARMMADWFEDSSAAIGITLTEIR